MYSKNLGAGVGHHQTVYFVLEAYDATKPAIISQKRLRFKIMNLWVIKSLTTDVNHMLRYFKTSYDFNVQHDGSTMFFVILKMVLPDTHIGF